MITLNPDLTVIERTGYTITDLLSDIGGLQGILLSAIAIVLGILNSNHLENYLASKLYKVDGSKQHTFLSRWRGKRANQLKEAREALRKEADIVKLIRSRRFVHLALKHLLDPQHRKQLKLMSQT